MLLTQMYPRLLQKNALNNPNLNGYLIAHPYTRLTASAFLGDSHGIPKVLQLVFLNKREGNIVMEWIFIIGGALFGWWIFGVARRPSADRVTEARYRLTTSNQETTLMLYMEAGFALLDLRALNRSLDAQVGLNSIVGILEKRLRDDFHVSDKEITQLEVGLEMEHQMSGRVAIPTTKAVVKKYGLKW